MAQVPPNSQMPQRFSGILNRLATGSYPVTRRLAGSYVLGRAVPGATQTFNIIASIQPTSPQDLFRLPEGRRTIDSITVWTETTLQEPIAPNGPEGDLISYGGKLYEVQRIFAWQGSGSFNKVIAQRQGQG